VQTLTGHEGSVMALLETGDGGVLSLGLDGSIKVREHRNVTVQSMEIGDGTGSEEKGLSPVCCGVCCVDLAVAAARDSNTTP
jgi:hypothetical protein